MCGISGIAGRDWSPEQLDAMVAILHHRGPDGRATYLNESKTVGLGHNRLSIIDLSSDADQPMANNDGSLRIVYNGEIYNYVELRSELSDYAYRSHSDTEVILAAYERWGVDCVEHFIGMFSFILWDARQEIIFAARDRFGVKPFYYAHLGSDTIAFASEIKALHAAGVSKEPDPQTWAAYLAYGLYEHSNTTFWREVKSLPPGHAFQWKHNQLNIWSWYDLAANVNNNINGRPEKDVRDEYQALMEESIRLRFRSDVPVGINLSGGLDSSTLLGMVHVVKGGDSNVSAFTFATGDERYDELPWVEQMLDQTQHPHFVCTLSPQEVPELAGKIQIQQDEPFGGVPTLAYSKIFEQARSEGVIVLLDGQGLDEQWAGYDYYKNVSDVNGNNHKPAIGPLQGSKSISVKPDCLTPTFRKMAQPLTNPNKFMDPLIALQHRDARYTKIPRALRFNDRISMMHSTELREPFLDHRLFELALCQPNDRKIRDGTQKWLLREITKKLLPQGIVEAPKRPLQTPQREWLRGPLAGWAEDCIQQALNGGGGQWLDAKQVQREWVQYKEGKSDNSFYVWQWVSLGLMGLAA